VPAELCGTGNFLSVAAIEPSPLEPLPADAVVTLTATVSYALLETDTAWVSAYGLDSYTLLYSQPVTVPAGCGEFSLTYAVPTTGESAIAIMLETPLSDTYATYLVYDVGSGPRFRVVGTSEPVGSVLHGNAQSVTVNVAYDTLGHDVWLTAYDYGTYTVVADYALTPAVGSQSITFEFPAPFECSADAMGIIELWDGTAGTYSTRVLFWYQRPAYLMDGFLDYTAAPTDPPLTDYVWFENCKLETLQGSLTSDAAWLQPSAANFTLEPRGFASVEVTANPAGLSVGNHTGMVTANVSGDTVSVAASLAILDATAYTATQAAYAWDTAADAGSGTLLFDVGADEGSAVVTVPFAVTLFGAAANTLHVGMNGFVSLDAVDSGCCQSVPSGNFTRTLFVDYDDHEVGAGQSVRYQTVGSAPNRRFVLSYNGVQIWMDPATRDTFQVIFYENQAAFRVQYGAMGQLGYTGIGDGAYIYTAWPAAGNTAFDITPQ
jgi:hypothetical protein